MPMEVAKLQSHMLTSKSCAQPNSKNGQKFNCRFFYKYRCCLHSRTIFCKSAIANGFTECAVYSRDAIDADFARQNEAILKKSRGGGYWLWKPYVIFKTLSTLSDGDFLFYGDAASNFIANAEPFFENAKRLNQYVYLFYDHLK